MASGRSDSVVNLMFRTKHSAFDPVGFVEALRGLGFSAPQNRESACPEAAAGHALILTNGILLAWHDPNDNLTAFQMRGATSAARAYKTHIRPSLAALRMSDDAISMYGLECVTRVGRPTRSDQPLVSLLSHDLAESISKQVSGGEFSTASVKLVAKPSRPTDGIQITFEPIAGDPGHGCVSVLFRTAEASKLNDFLGKVDTGMIESVADAIENTPGSAPSGTVCESEARSGQLPEADTSLDAHIGRAVFFGLRSHLERRIASLFENSGDETQDVIPTIERDGLEGDLEGFLEEGLLSIQNQ